VKSLSGYKRKWAII